MQHRLPQLLALLIAVAGSLTAHAADWPTYRHDNYRSGKTPEKLDVTRLTLKWKIQSSAPPQQAWAGPAKWDAYRNIKGLKSMRNYDPAFHPIIVGDAMLYGSSVDEAVHCRDAKTGKERWTFFTDGPIRVAPTWVAGKVYFGSDDGAAYCVDAKTGKLVWQYRPVERGRLIVNNGRLIPLWPIRTGVLVDDGVAYFAAGLVPWHPSYLCAVSAVTGKVEEKRHFVQKLNGVTMEGPLLCSLTKLIAPQGRVAPLLFERETGKKLKQLSGGGGVFVMITKDDHILHGPGNKTGWITDSSVKSGAKLASLPNANALVVHGKMAYVLTDRGLSALDRSAKKQVWAVSDVYPYEVILAGDVLFAGGVDEVAAFAAKTGKKLATWPVRGRAYGLAVANGALYVSTDEGEIRCFREGKGRRVVERPPQKETLPALLPVGRTSYNQKAGRWVFHRTAIRKGRLRDLWGKHDGVIKGPARFQRLKHSPRRKALDVLRMDGQTHIELAAKHTDAKLPVREITASAWVRIDKPQAWGGIIGAIQDNGSYERGWLLGYVGSHFCMAVNGKQGPNRLLYMKAKKAFQPGEWYHVAGVYDGKSLRLYINGKLSNSSEEQKGDIQYPPSAPYVIGTYKDVNEFFPLVGALHEVRMDPRAAPADHIRLEYEQKKEYFPPALQPVVTARPVLGPYLQFTGRKTAPVRIGGIRAYPLHHGSGMLTETATVRWKTAAPSTSTLELRYDKKLVKRYHRPVKTTSHKVVLDELRPNRQYEYVIRFVQNGKEIVSEPFLCDTFFNYTPVKIGEYHHPYKVWVNKNGGLTHRFKNAEDRFYESAARQILTHPKGHRGLCVILGSEHGRLAYELAKRSDLRIIGVDTDQKRVAAARRKLQDMGWYGSRVTIHHVEAYDKLPFTGGLANIVVSESLMKTGKIPSNLNEVMRVLRPGGIVRLGYEHLRTNKFPPPPFPKWTASFRKRQLHEQHGSWNWLVLRRPTDKDTGIWSHLYGRPDNSAFGGESLKGAKGIDDLEVQWIGRPGPRANPDRNGRRPAPLAVNGRLFVQGLERIIALDTHNGVILWSLEIPPFRRFNMPRDCGNWCADENYLYAAIGDQCWKIDAATGRVVDLLSVVGGPQKDWQWDWGYIARTGKMLLGSAVKKGSSHTNFFGGSGAGWYDARGGAVTHQICSDNLFALDALAGSRKWTYTAKGVILNPTLTIGKGRAYFVEARHPKIKSADTRRLGSAELWQQQYLIALDVATGKKLWEKQIKTVPGTVVFYLSYQDEKLVLVSSQKQYHVYTFDAKNGATLWQQNFRWQNGDHGGHMSRPAIVGGKVYVRPRVLDLRSGKILSETMPRGGCGTYACTTNAVIFRAGNITMWDRDKQRVTRWTRLRPDCWLSTIPAQGMLLSPEGGGGCSCGSWMETSVGFRPKRK